MSAQIIRNGSLFKSPHCSTKSALDKNFKAIPNSKKPKTTFTEFNQPPLLGKEFNHAGKAAKRANGNPSAEPKPSITNRMLYGSGLVAKVPARNEPKIGPVQLKETKANVIAMKKTPINPPVLEALSALLAKDDGNEIS